MTSKEKPVAMCRKHDTECIHCAEPLSKDQPICSCCGAEMSWFDDGPTWCLFCQAGMPVIDTPVYVECCKPVDPVTAGIVQAFRSFGVAMKEGSRFDYRRPPIGTPLVPVAQEALIQALVEIAEFAENSDVAEGCFKLALRLVYDKYSNRGKRNISIMPFNGKPWIVDLSKADLTEMAKIVNEEFHDLLDELESLLKGEVEHDS